MARCCFLLPLLLVFLSLPAYAKEPIRELDGVVLRVSDGDTIVVNSQGTKVKVRLYGIDAPETDKVSRKTGRISKPGQPLGEEAFRALEGKLAHQQVHLKVMASDRYNRLVSVVMLDDRDVNREMVAEGWAWAYRQYLDRPYTSDFIAAEEQARKARLGLWQQANPQPPWEFRASLRRGKHGRTDW